MKYKIGLELEISFKHDLNNITASDILADKRDCSINGEVGYTAREIYLDEPAPYYDGSMRKLAEDISELYDLIEAKSHNSCGLHVHVSPLKCDFDMQHFIGVVAVWSLLESKIIACVPEERLGGRWCKRNYFDHAYINHLIKMSINEHTRPMVYVANTLCDGRYKALNLLALRRHGSVEFRLFDAITDVKRIMSYIDLSVAIVNCGYTFSLLAKDHKLKIFDGELPLIEECGPAGIKLNNLLNQLKRR